MIVYFVTSNTSKIPTPTRVLARHGITVKPTELEVVEIQAPTVASVASAKACAAFRTIQAPVIVNDGAIFIDVLNGFPGTYIKHINKQIRIQGYLDLMARYPRPEQRTCTVQDAVAYMDATRSTPAVFVRSIRGRLTTEPRGRNTNSRLALSPIYIPDGYDKTYAEMTDAEYEEFRQRPEHEQAYEQLAAAILGTSQSPG